jgi:membrane associated rhomboid family serine protease
MLLLIPFDRKLDWRRPPLLTFALIVINVLVFFVFQADEEPRTEEALSYYAQSGLAEIEIPRYREYLREQDPENEFLTLPEAPSKIPSDWYLAPNFDPGFMQRLGAGEIVGPDEPGYDDWRRKRKRFEDKLAGVATYGYGLIPAKPTLQGVIGHMFLHGDLTHLLGNMFFLLAVGFLVEGTLGRTAFLVCYLSGGLISAGFDLVFDAERLGPGIGASGAIAGLMGMYAVLYWTRRVRFFYFIVAYFDYVSLPAIALLPIWLLNEGSQMLLDSAMWRSKCENFRSPGSGWSMAARGVGPPSSSWYWSNV